MKLLTEMQDGCVHSGGCCIDTEDASPLTVARLEHDAAAAHALMRAMDEFSAWPQCIGVIQRAIERRERLHPHCTLTLTRDIAPDKNWHWHVTMPNGHMYDVSRGAMSFEQALTDMQTRGVTSLDAADTIWRTNYPPAYRRMPEQPG